MIGRCSDGSIGDPTSRAAHRRSRRSRSPACGPRIDCQGGLFRADVQVRTEGTLLSEITEWLAGVNVAIGAWLVVVPFLLPEAISTSTGFAFWNYLLVGAGIIVLSGYNWWAAEAAKPGSALAAGASAVLGLWMIVVPYLTPILVTGWLLWNDTIAGGIVAVIGAYNAYQTVEVEEDSSRTTT